MRIAIIDDIISEREALKTRLAFGDFLFGRRA